MTKYLDKETYILSKQSPDDWINHANVGIISLYSKLITGSVLDFGCNNGATTFHLSYNKNVSSITGLDINEECGSYFNNVFKDVEIHNEFIGANILDVNFTNDSYDTILSFHTIEHIYESDLDEVVEKLYRLLKPSGYCIISIPYETAYNGPEHVSFFNEQQLKQLFERHMFETVECALDNRWSDANILTAIFRKGTS